MGELTNWQGDKWVLRNATDLSTSVLCWVVMHCNREGDTLVIIYRVIS